VFNRFKESLFHVLLGFGFWESLFFVLFGLGVLGYKYKLIASRKGELIFLSDLINENTQS
jgi:hypothetical protein